jgi:hypothetical protein
VNELYAINPKCLNISAHEVRLVLRSFGLQEGRFIADFPDRWIDEVLLNYPLGTKQHSVMVCVLERARDALQKLDFPYRYHKEWEANALALQSQRRRFEEIFSDRDSETTRHIAVLLNSLDFELKDGREAFVTAEANVYAAFCTPLFLCSEEIVLHDYFFSLRRADTGAIDSSRNSVLSSLLKAMVDSRRVRRFLILFNEDRFRSAMVEHVESDLTAISAYADPDGRIELIYDFDSMGAEGGSRHPRCIFSVKGGLQFDQGFQVLKNYEKNLIRWMSAQTLRPFQEKYLKRFHA